MRLWSRRRYDGKIRTPEKNVIHCIITPLNNYHYSLTIGKSLLWDATIRDTVAKSYVKHSSKNVGWVANTAEEQKISFYRSLTPQYFFILVGFETLGPWGKYAKKFIDDLGKKIVIATGEKRSKLYLKQRLSIDLQRGNAASVLGTLPSTHALDEVFYLLSKQKL